MIEGVKFWQDVFYMRETALLSYSFTSKLTLAANHSFLVGCVNHYLRYSDFQIRFSLPQRESPMYLLQIKPRIFH